MDADPRIERLDATWGDVHAWTANGLHWLHLPQVQALVNRRVSGDPAVSPLAWFAAHVQRHAALPLGRVLVLGCGSGRIERELRRRGWAREVVAFDLSPQVLDAARSAAAAEGLDGITYVQADMDAPPVGTAPFLPASFDAVLGISSVHHCGNLPALYGAVARLLAPDGWFFLDEYVGPDRFQYADEFVAWVRQVAALLPARLMTTAGGAVRSNFRAPTVQEVLAVDPTEAACSAQILALLPQSFRIVERRDYGGALLHLLLGDVAQHFGTPDGLPWLQALIDAEEEAMRHAWAAHHFSCVIARPAPPR